MTSSKAISWCMLLRLLPCLAVLAVQANPEETELDVLERDLSEALALRDEDSLERLIAPAFTIVSTGPDAETVVTRQEWLTNAMMYPWPRHEVMVLHVSIEGNAAVVHSTWRGKYPQQSLTEAGGDLRFLITDVWIRDGGRWRMLSRHSSLLAE